MPSIVVIIEGGTVLYQNVPEDIQEVVKTIRDGDVLPGFSEACPEVQINGMIVFAEQPPKPKRVVPSLSRRQIVVLQLLAKAYPPDQIALKLGLSVPTIRLHISALKEKFGTESRDQMMAMAGTLGLCDPFDLTPGHESIFHHKRKKRANKAKGDSLPE